MSRVFLVVLDSVGCGGAPDADRFFNGTLPDTGANTWGHIAQACAEGRAEDGRSGPLKVPNLASLGLGAAIKLASGLEAPALNSTITGHWGAATESSPGKDTPTGHWELAGVPLPWDWTYFPKADPAFPPELTAEVCRLAGTEGILGNCHAAGTEIITRLGDEHLRTGWPICYTSVDSVFQIAAHEEAFGLERLIKLCADLAPTLHAMRVGRVIARPFVGGPGDYKRTKNRRDFALETPGQTIFDHAKAADRTTYAIGKIGDIFSMRGVDELRKGTDAELMEHLVDLARDAVPGSFTFANFVEFDTAYGHRRDVSGYARALEWFDAQLPRVFAHLQPGDVIAFTADHGNDPTWPGTDHTRERVPLLVYGLGAGELGLMPFTGVADFVLKQLGVSTSAPHSHEATGHVAHCR